MQVKNITGALLAYERVANEINLANLCISICMHTDGEQYTDGETMDIVLEVCDRVRAEEQYEIRQLLENYEVIEPGGKE